MKICVVSQQLKRTISGVGLHTNNLIRSLLAAGHEVWVVAPEDQCPQGELPYKLVSVPPPLFRHNQARWISLSWNFGRVLRRMVREQHFDLIHFTDARESFFCPGGAARVGNINDTYSAELHPIAYYQRYYDDWLARSAYYNFVHLCEGLALPRLDAVIANSQFTARTVGRVYRVKAQRLYVCHKSIDPAYYQPALDLRRELEPHLPKVLFVGTNMQRKGLPLLIRSAPLILKILPATEFWIVGEDKVVPKMKALCDSLGVRDRFKFLGWKSQAELLDIYAQSDVFVMPSITEAFGVVFLEAMAAGVVPVGAAVGGIPEIIRHGENGMMIAPPGDPAGLADAVLAILTNRDFRVMLQENAIRTAHGFNVGAMMECTYQIYEAVTRQSAART
jgi:glycosyltransferase involved in cell wall biosynthesis